MSDDPPYGYALEDQPTGAQQTANPGSSGGSGTTPEFDPAETAFVEAWVKRIKSAKNAKKTKEAFEDMDDCMRLARSGATKDWAGDNYVVPILNRYTNQAVAQLYARNPQVFAKRKKRRMFTVWDGTMATLKEATDSLQASMQPPAPPLIGAPPQPPPPPPDPQAQAIVADAMNVKQYDVMLDGVADTMTILHNHFISDPAAQYKQQFKALVRRAKVCGVGYVKLSYQRILQPNPDVTVKLDEATAKMATLRGLLSKTSRDDLPPDSEDEEQLKTLIANLQDQQMMVVREGPVWSFPKSKRIIIDPACEHLKTFAGAGWLAEEYNFTPAEIEENWQVDVGQNFTAYKPENNSWKRWQSDKDGNPKETETAMVWRVMNRKTEQEFVVCEGYKGYIKPPGPPDIRIKRFWDIFPLVFNEIESDEDLYPPSDIWNARHIQASYNSKRQGIREHRMMNRPGYVTSQGTFGEEDMKKFEAHPVGAILETSVMLDKDSKIADKLQAKPVMQIDPKQYEVDSEWTDLLRTTGQQQAQMGPVADATATESSIAAQSQQINTSDSADDLDDLLSQLSQATGEVMLLNMTKDIVIEIVGPGAIWPDLQQTREEIAESILLDIRAGASGRPNRAVDLQNLQTAMPFVIQIPGINPIPFGQKYLDLLLPEGELEDAIVEGLPSMVALNQMAAKPPTPPNGAPPGEPTAQGAQGGANAQRPAGTQPGAAPTITHYDHQGMPIQK